MRLPRRSRAAGAGPTLALPPPRQTPQAFPKTRRHGHCLTWGGSLADLVGADAVAIPPIATE
jgi:hypothetical protein